MYSLTSLMTSKSHLPSLKPHSLAFQSLVRVVLTPSSKCELFQWACDWSPFIYSHHLHPTVPKVLRMMSPKPMQNRSMPCCELFNGLSLPILPTACRVLTIPQASLLPPLLAHPAPGLPTTSLLLEHAKLNGPWVFASA